jgi:hypothetical protein
VRVRNNILWVNAGRAIFVDSGSELGFTSDRNVITRGPNPIAPGDNAHAGFFSGSTKNTLADWQLASGQDSHSEEANAKWIDINGTDDVLGYSTAGSGYDGGRDDNFALQRHSVAIDRGDGEFASEHDSIGLLRHDDAGTPNTGVGVPNFVDIGAFEFQGDSDDIVAPTVLSSNPGGVHAEGSLLQSQRSISFVLSEPVNPVDANAASNYSLRSPGVTTAATAWTAITMARRVAITFAHSRSKPIMLRPWLTPFLIKTRRKIPPSRLLSQPTRSRMWMWVTH